MKSVAQSAKVCEDKKKILKQNKTCSNIFFFKFCKQVHVWVLFLSPLILCLPKILPSDVLRRIFSALAPILNFHYDFIFKILEIFELLHRN